MSAKFLSIAKSSNGTIGLITSTTMVEHLYPDSECPTTVWKGVIIEDNTFEANGKTINAKVGGLWTSSIPVVIGQATAEQIRDLAH